MRPALDSNAERTPHGAVSRALIGLLLSLSPLCACGHGVSLPAGTEQGPCLPGKTCNEGLVCASDLCVDVDGSQTSSDSETGATANPSDGDDTTETASNETGGDTDCEDQLEGNDCFDPASSGDTAGDSGDTAGDSGDTAGDSGDTAGDSGDTAGDSGDTAGDSGDEPECITQSQCQAACSSRVWICANCDVAAFCPAELNMDSCVWECETGNETALEIDTCALEHGHTCDEKLLIDCFFSTYC